jgi:hypothetical protein
MTLEWVEGKLGQMERRREGRGRSARRMEKGRKMKRGKCEKTSSQRQAAVEAERRQGVRRQPRECCSRTRNGLGRTRNRAHSSGEAAYAGRRAAAAARKGGECGQPGEC